jgi:hypothetical protein
VSPDPVYTAKTGPDGCRTIKAEKIFPKTRSFGLKYPNMFVKAEYDGMVAYGWLPLYEIQNVVFDGKDTYELSLSLKGKTPSDPLKFEVNR